MLTFSNKPLKLVIKIGLMIAALSLLMIAYFIYLYWRGEIAILGWASLMLSLWFLSGMIVFVLGVIGLYIGKIFDKVKNRPNYIVAEITK
jgi:dolichol-phosphate mannosyltransferase